MLSLPPGITHLSCNGFVGQLEDSPVRLRRMAARLKRAQRRLAAARGGPGPLALFGPSDLTPAAPNGAPERQRPASPSTGAEPVALF